MNGCVEPEITWYVPPFPKQIDRRCKQFIGCKHFLLLLDATYLALLFFMREMPILAIGLRLAVLFNFEVGDGLLIVSMRVK